METGYTEVYVWGSNHMGQLGLGQRYPKKKLPAPCVCSYHIKIRRISCGDEHTAFIASTGHLYTMGSNEKGRLGISDTSVKYVPSPCLVESLSGYKLIKVECGGSHTAVLTSDYRAFTWGCGSFGALGTGMTQDEFSPIQIALNNVRDLSCGYRHTAFLTKEGEGKVYITGANESGQLGVGNTERQLNPVGLQLDNCRQIACGIFHTLILTDTSVYSMGGNTFGQLGTGDKRPNCRPGRIKSLDNAGITKVVCGHHSAALSDHGELYLWGTGVFGEYLTPHKVTHVTQFFKDIAIGACFGAAIDMNERLWTWGSNSNGELGVGDFDFRVNPYPILSLTGKRVKGLACGGSFAIALGEDVLQNNTVQTIPIKETRFVTPSKDKENIAGRANSCVATAKIVRKKNLSIESTPRSEHASLLPLSSKKNLNISPMIKQPSAIHNLDTSYTLKPPASVKNLDKPCISQPSSRIESNNSYEDRVKSLEKQLIDKERQITQLLSALDKLQSSPGSSSTRAEPNPTLEKKLDEANAELSKEQELRKKLADENRKLEVALAAQYQKQSTQREELRQDIIKRDEEILAIKQEYEMLRLTLDQLSHRNQEFMKNISHENFDKSELEDRIKELETAIQTQSQEISSEKQSLLHQISQLKASNSSLKEENEMLVNQLQDQSSTIPELTRIIQDWEKKYETLEKHSSSLKHAVDQMEDKNIRLVETMEKEIMVRARKYKERALNVLNTPTRVSASSVMRESPVPPIALPRSVERYQNQSPNLSEYKSDNEGISPRLYILGDEEDFYEIDSKKECEDIVFENITVEESPCNPPTFRDNTFSSFGSKADVTLELDVAERRKIYTFKDQSGKENSVPIYASEDDVTGRLVINLKKGKKLEHQGIKIELIGRIDINYERTQTSDFVSLSRDLEPAGAISESTAIPFAFNRVEKQFETYAGKYCRLRYFLRAVIAKGFTGNTVREKEFAVFIPTDQSEQDTSIKMEVGIEECLHIEFEYNKHRYNLNECILGKVYFLLVRIRIKYMEIAIVRREIIGAGQNSTNENETIAKFEVMDGAPVRGENIPIRMFLGAFDLTPTYNNVNNKFSVKHFLNLVLVDDEDRRYFKQQEITLWRKD